MLFLEDDLIMVKMKLSQLVLRRMTQNKQSIEKDASGCDMVAGSLSAAWA